MLSFDTSRSFSANQIDIMPSSRQKPVPNWNWKRCSRSPVFALSGLPKLSFNGPIGDTQLMPRPAE